MLQIEKITLKNIRTFNEETAEFSEGVNVIVGKNGAGKTTLIQAIYGSLTEFKNLASGLKIADFIRKGATSGEITLYFKYNDKKFRIRTILAKKGVKNQSIEQRINSNWKIIAEGKQKEVKEAIEQITGTKISTLKKIVYCPQGELTDIISGDKKDREKVFKYLLELEKYEKAKEIANNLKKEIKNKIETKNQLILTLESTIQNEDDIREKLKQYHKEVKTIEPELEKLKLEQFKKQKEFTALKQKKEKYNMLQGKISQQTQTLNQQQIEKKKLETEIKNLWKKAGAKEIPADQLKTEIKSLKKQKDSIITEKTKTEAELKRQEEISKELEKTQQKVKESQLKEKALIQQLKESLKDEYISDIASLKNKILEKLEVKNGEKQELEEEISEKREFLASKTAVLKQRNKDLKNKEKEIKELSKTIEDLDSKHGLSTLSKEKIEEKINNIETKLESNRSNLNQISREMGLTSSKLEQLKQRNGELKKAIDMLLETSSPRCPVCGSELNEEHKKELIDKYTKEINENKEKQKTLRKKSKELNQDLERIKKENEELEKQITLLRERKDLLEQYLQSIDNKERLLKEAETIKKEILELKEQIKKVEPEIIKQSKQLAQIAETISKYETIKEKINELEKIISGLEPLLQRIEELKAESSPELAKEFKIKLEKLKNEQAKLESSLSLFEDLLNKLNKLKDLENDILSNQESLRKAKEELESLGFDKKIFEKVEEEVNRLNKEIQEKQIRLRDLQNELIPGKEEELNRVLDAKKQIEQHEKEIEELQQSMEYLDETIKLLNNLPSVITKSRLTNAQARANQIVKRFFEDRDIDGIKIGVEKYEITALRGGLEEDIRRFSGGEQAVMAFALRVALLQELGRVNFMLLDEPTAALDRERVEEFINFLETDNPVKQLILVTHRDEFMRTASIPIVIERGKRESKIVYNQ